MSNSVKKDVPIEYLSHRGYQESDGKWYYRIGADAGYRYVEIFGPYDSENEANEEYRARWKWEAAMDVN